MEDKKSRENDARSVARMLCRADSNKAVRLDDLLSRARHHVMTSAERAAQQKSWVIGEMMLEHPEMTREEAERIYSQVTD